MLDAHVFSWFINTMHINGLSTLLSRLVYKYSNVSYADFYSELFDYIQHHDWLRKEQDEVRQYYTNWMSSGKIEHPSIGIEIHGWNLIHRSIINMHVEKQYESIFDMLEQFMQRYNLPENLLASAMKFQRNYLVAYEARNNYPMNVQLDYNLWEFLSFDQDLKETPVTYHLEFPEDKTMSFPRFLELFYFARRRNFGKATVENLNANVVQNAARRGEGASKAQGSFSVKQLAE
jgi:hypothetical protein